MKFQSVFWDLAFRPLFLAASLMSIFSFLVWALILNGAINWQPLLNPLLWHVHEMIFGFALTVAVGFLLTAVQTWTGLRSLNGQGLALLCGLWLLARLLIWQNIWPANTALFIALLIVQASWWVVFISFFARLLVRAGSRRNYLFIPLLATIAVLNLAFIQLSFSGHEHAALHLAQSTILFFAVMIAIISGRIMPMFTRNGCRMAGIHTDIRATDKTDKVLLWLSLFGAISFLLGAWLDLFYQPAWILISVGLLHLYRQTHWAPFATLSVPLLWSLHLSYLCLGFGVILIGISKLTPLLATGDAFHLLTVGTLGGMILAMISRVSLGHTGRPLQVNTQMSVAFSLIFGAALMRLLLPLMDLHLLGWNLSVLCWCLAFALFCRNYFPVLTKA